MFDALFEKDAGGTLKALTLEWACPKCGGMNFRILSQQDRAIGEYHGRCRYCRTRCRVTFPPPARAVDGEAEFMKRISYEDFTDEERTDMLRDYAEIESLIVDKAAPGIVREKKKALDEKIAFAKRRRR